MIVMVFPKLKKIRGITLFPFIFLRSKSDLLDRELINHEKIHIRQQLELLIFPFYLLYLGEYFFWLMKLKDGYKAYRAISFEREAYENEADFSYLKNRKFWNFTKYFRK